MTLLIPTDFSIGSLSLLKVGLHHYPDTPLRIIFVHGISMGDSIPELLFFSPARTMAKLEDRSFMEACSVMRNRFTQITGFHNELFTSGTQAVFDKMLERYAVDAVIVPEPGMLRQKLDTSIDLIPFLQKCEVRKIPVAWEAKPYSADGDLLSALFAG